MKKDAKFINFKKKYYLQPNKNNQQKIKTELKTFKTESFKQLSESLTWYKNETNVLKEEVKGHDYS